MRIKCIAIDDEPLALRQLESYILKTPFLECSALCKSAFEAMEYINQNQVDLMFVDINMPDLSGMDFVKSLINKPQVVFITAYREYALEGFKVDAIDYLLKPVGYADFFKSANKARLWFELNDHPLKKTEIEEEIFVKSESKIVRIKIDEILYVESANEYIKIFSDNNEMTISLMRLKDFDFKLPQLRFMRIHRSFIINLNKIKAVEKNRVILNSGKAVPIGELFRENFQTYLDKTFRIE